MGYPHDVFLDENINEEFICSICAEVFKEPVVLGKCEHIFCKGCISDWLRDNATCPIDRSKVSALDIRSVHRPFLNLLNQLKGKCLFTDKGCDVVTTLGNWEQHLANCKFNPEYRASCEFDCGAYITAAEKFGHICVSYLKGVIESKDEVIAKLTSQLRIESREDILRRARMSRLVKNVQTNLSCRSWIRSLHEVVFECIKEQDDWFQISNSIQQRLGEMDRHPWGCLLETSETMKLKVSTIRGSFYLDFFLEDLRIIMWKK